MTVITNNPPKSDDVRISDLIVYAGVGVLLSSGALLGCNTLWNLVRLHYFFYTTDLGVELSTTVTFLAAALLTLPIAWTANVLCSYPKSTSVLGVLVFLVCAGLLTLVAGTSALLGLSQTLRSPNQLNASMHSSMLYVPVSTSVKKAFNYMQLGLQCCGVDSPADWLKVEGVLPPSCCNRLKNQDGEKCVTAKFTNGCLLPTLYELRFFVNGLTFLATTTTIVLAVIIVAGALSILQRTAWRDQGPADAAIIIFSASYSVVDHLMSAVRKPSLGQPFFVLSDTALETQTYSKLGNIKNMSF